MEIIESILTNNPCYKAGKRITVKGLMLHSVGCPQPSAETFVRKWNRPEEARACVHAFIDGNTGKVYQTLPWDYRAWHGGGSSNNSYIGVEMCEPACIRYTGGSAFVCSHRETALAVVKRTYDAAVELFAFLCEKFQLNPMADGVIISHKEGHDRGIASGHADPDHLWNGLQSGYTMDGFRRDVCAAMGNGRMSLPPGQQGDAQKEIHESLTGSAPKENNGALQAGDIVMLASDAVYYTGKEIPDWVKNDKWIVKSVSGDRAVIDKNVSESKSICSPVHVKYLIAAAIGLQCSVSVPQAAYDVGYTEGEKTAKANESGEMAVSDCGVELIAKYEGCRLEAYKCPAGIWTIGYGHTQGVKSGDKLPSQEAAKALLKEDLKKYGGYVNNCFKKGLITFPLSQNQFDALTSFCYNCGNGSLQKLVTGRSAAAIAETMLQYNKGGGKVLAGLVRRREEERALFLK